MKVLDLGVIKTRGVVLRARLDPILDMLVIANMKIGRYQDSGQEIPENLTATRDKVYELVLEILKDEGDY